MTIATLGLLHPGAMGVTVGAAAVETVRVVWASEGRSRDTRARAEGAGFEDVKTLGALTATADAVVSVCPPHGALALAEAVAATGFVGRYVDANAVSPATVLEIEEAATAAPKAWRFAGEMEEIASTLDAAGLPDGFHRAAAEAYARLSGFRGEPVGVSVDDVVAALLGGDRSGRGD